MTFLSIVLVTQDSMRGTCTTTWLDMEVLPPFRLISMVTLHLIVTLMVSLCVRWDCGCTPNSSSIIPMDIAPNATVVQFYIPNEQVRHATMNSSKKAKGA